MMSKKQEIFLKLVLAFFSMTFLTYMGSVWFKSAQFDFTEEKLYTLSKGTKSILSKLDSPVKLKLYYSKKGREKETKELRAFSRHFKYVRELLNHYVAHSRNNLSLKVIEARAGTPEEQDAYGYGLQKFHISDSQTIFFGLVAENDAGVTKLISFIDPAKKSKLEYELTKLIYKTLYPQKKKVGILSSVPVLSEQHSPYISQIMRLQGKDVSKSWLSIKLLQEHYELKHFKSDVAVISGIDVLVIIHPKNFSDNTLLAIDQFLMRGGNLIIFADPNFISDSFKPDPATLSSSPDKRFLELLKAWGFDFDPGLYVGDKTLSAKGKLTPQMTPQKLLGILNCDQRCVAPYYDPITSEITDATFIFPGRISYQKKESLSFFPIISTTSKGNVYPVSEAAVKDPASTWDVFQEGEKPIYIGGKLIGFFSSAFSREQVQNLMSTTEHKKKSETKAAIVFFADVDFINDPFAFKKSFLGAEVSNDNSMILLNSVETLVGNTDLVSVKAKGNVDRTFDLINEIENKAKEKTFTEIKEIEKKIERYQAELKKLDHQINQNTAALVQNNELEEKKKLAKKIATLKRELKDVKQKGKEKVDNVGTFFRLFNSIFVPLLVIIIAFYFHRKRQLVIQEKRVETKK